VAVAIILACYLPYGVFAEWTYLRFLLPAFPFVFVGIGALVAQASLRLPAAARGIAVLAALTAAASANVAHAVELQVFNLARYEARYRSAGRYLAAALPRDAVIVTVQESASAHYYTGLPIVRWDMLPVDLDEAVAALRARGRHPVLLVEDWEMSQLAAKFPRSRLARLDWPPQADFGQVTRVRLFDPLDRNVPAATRQIDRVP
jgi:hypothetical protein